jgi:hypothetical protein
MPRLIVALHLWGYAPGAAFGPKALRPGPDQGIARKVIRLVSAGQSHRLTSDGKAELDILE